MSDLKHYTPENCAATVLALFGIEDDDRYKCPDIECHDLHEAGDFLFAIFSCCAEKAVNDALTAAGVTPEERKAIIGRGH